MASSVSTRRRRTSSEARLSASGLLDRFGAATDRDSKSRSKPDELDLVADELNQMRSSLQKSFATLKESESKYRELYDTMAQGVIYRNENGEIDFDLSLKALSVEGNTQIIGSPEHPDYVHPVAKLVHERKRNGSKCTGGQRKDGHKVAMVVEGGGVVM